jgi:hypothetical protein
MCITSTSVVLTAIEFHSLTGIQNNLAGAVAFDIVKWVNNAQVIDITKGWNFQVLAVEDESTAGQNSKLCQKFQFVLITEYFSPARFEFVSFMIDATFKMVFDGSTRKDVVTGRFIHKQGGVPELAGAPGGGRREEDTSADERISIHPLEKKPRTIKTPEEYTVEAVIQNQIISIRNIYKEEFLNNYLMSTIITMFIIVLILAGCIFFYARMKRAEENATSKNQHYDEHRYDRGHEVVI